MKKIYIQVLSGAYNLGDELILRSEIDFIGSVYPDAKFFIGTYNEASFFGSKKNCEFLSFFPNNIRKHPLRNLYYFFKNIVTIFCSDIIVVGGGGIFFDNEPGISFDKNLLEWRLRLFFAKIFRKKIIFLGISIEVKNEENQKKLAKWLQSFSKKYIKIFPRDKNSTKILEKFGLPAETLYDSVFLSEPKLHQKNTPKKPKKI